MNREQLLEDAVVDKCRELLEERGVVVFPRVNVTDAEQLVFTDRLGNRVNFTSNIQRAIDSVFSSMKSVTDAPSEAELKRWALPPIKRHPLVWTHRSERKSLIIGNTAERIVDMPFPEGRALLARLLEWTAQPDCHYRHYWQLGDLVVWNNTGTLHRAIPCDRTSGRTMHRTSIAGIEETA